MLATVFVASVVIFYDGLFKYIPLGNGVTWEYSWRYWEEGKPRSSLTKNGRGVVGPAAGMRLWGAYPYIAGTFVVHDETGFRHVNFLYNIDEDQAAFYNDWQVIEGKHLLPLTSQMLVSFWDLAGFYKKPKKLEALRDALKPPDTSKPSETSETTDGL